MCDYPGQFFFNCVATKEDLEKRFKKLYKDVPEAFVGNLQAFAGDSEAFVEITDLPEAFAGDSRYENSFI